MAQFSLTITEFGFLHVPEKVVMVKGDEVDVYVSVNADPDDVIIRAEFKGMGVKVKEAGFGEFSKYNETAEGGWLYATIYPFYNDTLGKLVSEGDPDELLKPGTYTLTLHMYNRETGEEISEAETAIPVIVEEPKLNVDVPVEVKKGEPIVVKIDTNRGEKGYDYLYVVLDLGVKKMKYTRIALNENGDAVVEIPTAEISPGEYKLYIRDAMRTIKKGVDIEEWYDISPTDSYAKYYNAQDDILFVKTIKVVEAANYLPDKNFTKVVDGKVYEINYRTALGVLEKASELGLLTYELKSSEWGLFVDCIDGICTGDAGATSGWMYWVNYPNESMPMVSADSYTVHPGDTVTWYFAKTWEDTPETSTCVINIHINSDYTIEVSKNCVKPITPVANVTIYPSSSTVSPDSTTTINILIDAVPTGISYANITVEISNSSVAEITDIEFPTWATLTDNSSLPASTVWFKVGDLSDQVKAGDTNVVLATLTIKGLTEGSSNITITVNSFQDDNYQNIENQIVAVPGTITVIVSPPPINGVQPKDLNGDGLFEDVNGDESFNFGDIVFFFKNFDKPEIKNYPQFYDFNGDCSVNFGDVVALFKML